VPDGRGEGPQRGDARGGEGVLEGAAKGVEEPLWGGVGGAAGEAEMWGVVEGKGMVRSPGGIALSWAPVSRSLLKGVRAGATKSPAADHCLSRPQQDMLGSTPSLALRTRHTRTAHKHEVVACAG
jgi:hypothetical protein